MTIEKLPSGKYRVGAQVFDTADDAIVHQATIAKHQSYAPPPHSRQESRSLNNSPVLKGVAIAVLCIFLIFLVVGTIQGNSPEGIAKQSARDAIDVCWKDQSRASYDPPTKRFVASVCERLEEDFRKKYRLNP